MDWEIYRTTMEKYNAALGRIIIQLIDNKYGENWRDKLEYIAARKNKQDQS